jgi:hypothetical protein
MKPIAQNPAAALWDRSIGEAKIFAAVLTPILLSAIAPAETA